MVGIFELDEKDKMILEILERNPEISQNEIAKEVGLSQPSVGARIKKMRELGIINHAYGINLKNAGLYVLKVDLKCRQPRDLINVFSGCPFFLNGFIVAGNKNLTMMFIGEDLSTLEAIVDQHIRPDPNVYDIDVGIVVRAERDTVVPMRIHIEPADTAPCNSNCDVCDYWQNELCLGCPITGHYRGKIWK
ncbi:transcriptional regulator, AsnC family [Archaeoglobus sulfaticallidus PM70-1]|uniref:Transcriptional regulator, AsnC family n=1 Tax=Archaeoglobus sulfaticallidus PM70-1 TaxID=387631 RepID=N0BFP7_9EURY|nr:winged helix-turn-helix transcriptional regulator [Archaeoglobus sulfaticallidus]AGK61853.1 transcriptional regulator, AsnC family [Archaeoglobus sulfaticallidus PM70-1]